MKSEWFVQMRFYKPLTKPWITPHTLKLLSITVISEEEEKANDKPESSQKL